MIFAANRVDGDRIGAREHDIADDGVHGPGPAPLPHTVPSMTANTVDGARAA